MLSGTYYELSNFYLLFYLYMYLQMLSVDSKNGSSLGCCSNETAYSILDIYVQSINRKQQAPRSKKNQKEISVWQVSISNSDLSQSSSLLSFSCAFIVLINSTIYSVLSRFTQYIPKSRNCSIPSFSLVFHIQCTCKFCHSVFKMSIFFFLAATIICQLYYCNRLLIWFFSFHAPVVHSLYKCQG